MAIRTVLGAAAVLTVGAVAANAQSAEAQIRSQLEAQGFGEIEIEREDGRIEVDARRGAQRIDLTYDARTGALLDREAGTARGEDDDDRNRLRGDRGDDRDGDRDDGRGDDDGNRGDRDDRGGDDDGADGRGGGGHGGRGGDDDRGGDDRGGDDGDDD